MTSAKADDGVTQLRAEMLDLEARKELLEIQIESDHNWLTAQGLDPRKMPLQLVDEDGFPKAGVDHHGARIHANQMHCAINDHKKIVSRLAEILNKYHQLIAANKESGHDS